MKAYCPIMLDIQNRQCIVVGGGTVAYRKVQSLLSYGAEVTLISKEISEKFLPLEQQGRIRWIARNYQEGDIDGAYLVYVATDDSAVNEQVYAEAHDKGILVNVVDVPPLCDFIVPAVVRQGDLTLAISTNGKSPMLARKIRQDLEKQFGREYEIFLKIMGKLRERIGREIPDINTRTSLYERLVYADYLQRLQEEEEGEIFKEMEFILEGCIQGGREEITCEEEDCCRD